MSETFDGLSDVELLEMLRLTEEWDRAEDEEWCRAVRQELKRRWMTADEARRQKRISNSLTHLEWEQITGC